MRLVTIALVATALVASCAGDDGAAIATESPDSSGDAPRSGDAPTRSTEQVRYTATTTVLESPQHGPQLCLGGVQESYPPQCSGPDVLGWDWNEVDGEESANGTTWGTYTVVGAWDGESLALTEPPASPDSTGDNREYEGPDFTSPCAEPEGGWQVIDETKTSDASMQDATAYAQAQPAVGGIWVDQSINPALEEDPIDESRANDPAKLILNVSFTDDLAEHEAAIREVWGGALCVSQAPISAEELATIRSEVEDEVGDFLFSSVDEIAGQIEISVTVDDGLQQHFDARYGKDIVVVHAQLRRLQA